MSAAAALLRTLRFRLWAAALRVRLSRHGIRVTVRAVTTPRFHTLPRVELGLEDAAVAGPGSLELRLGRDVRLGRDLVLQVSPGAASRLDAGDGVVFESWCRVQLEGGVIVLGDGVHVRDLVLLKSKSVLDVGGGTVLSRAVAVHATAGVRFGRDCGIGERTSVIDSDHTADGSGPPLHTPLKLGPVEIGDHVLVSANAVILRGTRIGDGAVIAANAVCNGTQVPEHWLAGGAPAEPLRVLPVAGVTPA